MRIFVDCDDVLCDFVGAVCSAYGLTREAFNAAVREKSLGQWGMATALGCSLEDFWTPMTAISEQFWAEIPPLSHLGDLLRLVESYAGENWYVVTDPTPQRCPTCYSGKAKWFAKHFPQDFNRVVYTAHKHLLASSSHYILIDDKEENIFNWLNAGGTGILFPTLHNSAHRYADNPLDYVRDALEHL